MIDITNIIVIELFIIFLAGIVHGLTGFGFALVSVPILMLFLSPQIIVPVISLHNTLINLFLLYEVKKWIDLRRIWPLMIAGIVGMPVGTFLLMVMDVNVAKLYIGLVIAIFAAALLMGFKKEIKNERVAFAPVGLVSGILGGSTSMSGPPVILFFTNQGVKMETFRANLIAYFTVLDLTTTIVFLFRGITNSTVINYAIILIPAMIFGAITGVKLKHKVNEKLFRKITLIIVIFAGILSIFSGLRIF